MIKKHNISAQKNAILKIGETFLTIVSPKKSRVKHVSPKYFCVKHVSPISVLRETCFTTPTKNLKRPFALYLPCTCPTLSYCYYYIIYIFRAFKVYKSIYILYMYIKDVYRGVVEKRLLFFFIMFFFLFCPKSDHNSIKSGTYGRASTGQVRAKKGKKNAQDFNYLKIQRISTCPFALFEIIKLRSFYEYS